MESKRDPDPAKPVPDWEEIFAACDEAGFEGFLEECDQNAYEVRESLDDRGLVGASDSDAARQDSEARLLFGSATSFIGEGASKIVSALVYAYHNGLYLQSHRTHMHSIALGLA